MDGSLQELNQKIDQLSAQVGYLSEQAKWAERQRMERAELVRDVTPLANQAFNTAIEQLEEVQEYIDLNDLLRLFKRLLRNGRNLEKILDQLESLADLIETVGPLADEAFGKAVDIMTSLEARGYFVFTQSGMKLLDSLITTLKAEDIDRISESIGPIVNMVNEITQPEVINFANQTLTEAKEEMRKPVDVSYMGLLRQMRDPAVRRGLALTLRIIQVVGNQAAKVEEPGQ